MLIINLINNLGGDLFTKVANRVSNAQEHNYKSRNIPKNQQTTANIHRIPFYTDGNTEGDQILTVEAFDEHAILRYIRQICEGLDEIHRAKLIHRDIKVYYLNTSIIVILNTSLYIIFIKIVFNFFILLVI